MDDYYSKIAKSYNELYGEEQKKKFKLIDIDFKPLVLDIGCGTGIVDFGVKTVGIDPSLGLLKQHKGVCVCARAEALPFKNNSFRGVISLTALHHTNVDKVISEIKRVAIPNAHLGFTILKKAKNCQEIVSKLKSEFSMDEQDEGKDIILTKH